jgi:oxygen-dependent protoporphyrinogen oxidase
MNPTTEASHVVVAGGGISGLSAAWQIVQQAPAARVTLLERDARWGGKIITDRLAMPTSDSDGTPVVVDSGPESFITRKSAAWDLAGELRLREQVVGMASETSNVYVLDAGHPELVPLSPVKFVKSPLLSTRGKLRLLAEPFVPARRDAGDESLADFAARRLGREALEKFLGPILGGIYNTDPERQSILTTSPVMREMERDHGGLFVASIARARAKAQRRKELAARGETLPPAFMAFRGGAQVFTDALAARLAATGRVDLRTQAELRGVQREGDRYALTLQTGQRLAADALVLATPANAAAALLAEAAPESAALLGQIRHASIGTLSLLYRERDMALGFPISGLMIPRREHRAIDAITFTSRRFPERIPAGYGMLRVFFGGSAPHIMVLDDGTLLAAVRGELRALLGIAAEPLAWVAHRWPDSYPQAAVGHLDHVAAIERSLPAGLYVTGSAYRGLGVPDCVAQGRATGRLAAEYVRGR